MTVDNKEVIKENQEQLVKQEKVTYIRSTYSWSTQYAKEKFEEQRTITIPEGVSNNIVYAYQVLTQLDLCHMVIFNAANQGIMGEEEYLDILGATKNALKRILPYIKEAKDNKSEVYEDMLSIYARLKRELQESDLWE